MSSSSLPEVMATQDLPRIINSPIHFKALVSDHAGNERIARPLVLSAFRATLCPISIGSRLRMD
ncbi:hypothetical protein PhaeoP23_03701 (plasmid) [Phaeobacter piscinae]|uniref:Uncharacterized protein n=1 Tax=Phaeobacter piscinae TaxID=1580596 RepID=A0ABN5DTZ5_9RHOB|nr:hypothetical protein PhaeoP36_03701 [Phaeobacter piscinae]AUQ88299.1 hypothetical protein PhaeoP42_03702 [Phaeobacter piscinae]AUR26182.1 hypothetical protein PhaeoP23_03701 [Phaeobacter piscinae]